MRESMEAFEESNVEDEGPQEGDWATEDHLNFYEVGGRGKLQLTLRYRRYDLQKGETQSRDARSGELSDASMWKQLRAEMDRQKFFPNVWFISDHGNAHLMAPPVRKRVRKRR